MNNNTTISRRSLLRTGSVLVGAAAIGLNGFPRPARAKNLDNVKVITSGGDLSGTLQSIMKDRAFDEQFGVSIEYISVSEGSKINAGLLSGSGDLCAWSGFSQVFPAIERGGSFKFIGGCVNLPTLCLYSAKPNVQSVKDLPGKSVATGAQGSLLHMLVVALLRKYGVDENKVQFVNVGSSADSFRAAVAGKVDVGISPIDVHDQQAKFGVHNLVDGKLWDELPNFTMQAAYADGEMIKKKRDLIVRALAAHAKMYRYLSTPESWDGWSKAYTGHLGQNADLVRAKTFWKFFQDNKPLAVDLVLSEERFRYAQELNVSVDVQKKILPYAQIADMSLAVDAIKLLG